MTFMLKTNSYAFVSEWMTVFVIGQKDGKKKLGYNYE